MKSYSRRFFLKTGFVAGATSLSGYVPAVHSKKSNHDYDVVVIGAGVAGMAATEVLTAKGHSVLCIEASARKGGRAQTDHGTFGLPYDRGAHWLHNANDNPFVNYGKENGFDLYESPLEESMFVGDRPATSEEYESYQAEYAKTYRALEQAGGRGKDVSAESVVPLGGQWDNLVHLNTGPFEMAKDYGHFSCKDWYSGEDGTDWYCREGFGDLILDRFRGVEAKLDTKAIRIDWSGNKVVVETSRGRITAGKCIVTVSTGVLASNSIRFSPSLPTEKQEAFHDISMGVYNHIALQFSENIFSTPADGYLFYDAKEMVNGSPKAMSMLTNISGTNLSFGEVGGAFASELEQAGVSGGVEFALEELEKIFGPDDTRKYFVKGDATLWGKDPNFLGSYASAEPGKYAARSALRQSVGGKLLFAGEACHPSYWATAHGAYASGREAANQIHFNTVG